MPVEMRYEPTPEAPHREPTPDGERTRRSTISWRTVATQAVGFSLVAWALTGLLALVFVAFSDRAFAESARISAAITTALVLAFGLVGTQRGPIPLGLGGEPGLVRTLGPMSLPQDSMLRPFRTRSREVHETEHNGLTSLGIALVLVPQLVAFLSLV
jgi:hypothetical protein